MQTWKKNEGGDIGRTENADERITEATRKEVPVSKKWKEERRGLRS